MTPEVAAIGTFLSAIGAFLDKNGLPTLMLIGLGWALVTRRLTLGSETNYVEARRVEEREGRLKAEQAVVDGTAANRELADAMEQLADVVVKFMASGGDRGARG